MTILLEELREVDENFVLSFLRFDMKPSEMPENGEKQRVDEQEGEARSAPPGDQGREKEEGDKNKEKGAGQDPDEDDGKTETEPAASGLSNFKMHDQREHGLILSFV
jgi:hypothetical protein